MIGIVILGAVVLIAWGIWVVIDGEWVERDKAKARRQEVIAEVSAAEREVQETINRLWEQLKHYY